jgi:uncharacterized protein (DUF305 family)
MEGQMRRVLTTLAVALGCALTLDAQQHDHPYDMQFIDMMIHHHHDGVKMAGIEERDGDRADVKAFAQKTAEGQKKDIAELQAIRDRLFKGHPTADVARVAGMSMQMMMDKGKQDMAKLERAGEKTDDVFLQVMASHHQDALRMSNEGMKRLRDAELRKLAAKMNAMQTKELDEIKRLRSLTK